MGTHMRVLVIPFACKEFCQAVQGPISFRSSHSIHRESQWSEIPSPVQACLKVLVLLLLFMLCEDLEGRLGSVGFTVQVGHSDVKDAGPMFVPETMDTNVSSLSSDGWLHGGLPFFKATTGEN